MQWHIPTFYSEFIFVQHKFDNFGKHTELGTSLIPRTEIFGLVKLQSLACWYHCVRGTYCLHLQNRMFCVVLALFYRTSGVETVNMAVQ
jgi:hypothetical protein